jgi:hypothetical protein
MAAATKDRDTQQRAGQGRAFPVAASTVLFAGVIACVNASGQLVNGATATTLKCVGVTRARIDNGAGAAGAVQGEAWGGVYGPFDNSASTDQIARADIGADCWIVDNQTVAKTNGTNTRSVAGKVWDVDADGRVWVNFTA